MSGRMQENSDIAVRLVPEETRAGGMTTLVLWRAEASIRMERMASALATASKEADYFFREVSYCSHYPRFDAERDVPDVETSNQHGSEGGEAKAFPTPITGFAGALRIANPVSSKG